MVGERSDWSIFLYQFDLPIVFNNTIGWFQVPIFYLPIVSVHFKFWFFNHTIFGDDLKLRFLYQLIVSVCFKLRFFNRPMFFLVRVSAYFVGQFLGPSFLSTNFLPPPTYSEYMSNYPTFRYDLIFWLYQLIQLSISRFNFCIRRYQPSLKGVWHEIFDFRFFHESVSPKPPSVPLGPFWIFSKILGDIREWIFIAGVVDTGD